jgi:hypothetical protein
VGAGGRGPQAARKIAALGGGEMCLRQDHSAQDIGVLETPDETEPDAAGQAAAALAPPRRVGYPTLVRSLRRSRAKA